MIIAKLGKTRAAVLAVLVVGLLGIVPMDLLISIVGFAMLMRGSVLLIDKAIDNGAQVNEIDRH